MKVPYTQSTRWGARRSRAPSRPSVVSRRRCASGPKRAAAGCHPPPSPERPPPAMPVPGVRASASTRLASAPGSTRASGFRNTSTSPRATSAPRFAPAAKPRLAPVSTSRTCGWRAQAAPALPSLEALSTSTISGAGTPPAARLARHASRAWPAFQLTMMTETVTRAGGAARRRPARRLAEGRAHREGAQPWPSSAANTSQSGPKGRSPSRRRRRASVLLRFRRWRTRARSGAPGTTGSSGSTSQGVQVAGGTIAEERARPGERAPDGGEGARQVVGELLRALPIEELVCVAVAPHLVPGRGDLAHDFGMAVRDPAEDEEGGARAVRG